MAYKQYRLSEIAMVEISGVDKKYLEGESEVQLCNFVDVYRNWAITSNMTPKFMIATARPNEIQRFKLKRGQVALTKDSETRYDIGISTYIADDLDNVILGYHNALITPNPDKLSGKYLNALLHTDYAKKYFANNASGSGQRYALGVDALNSFPVYIPQLAEQERIGEIFSLIDRKIALNRQINDNLEAMAKQLYNYWFVQFDFPDENGKPYKSSGGKMVWNDKLKREIPACFRYIEVGDITQIVTGKEDANFSTQDGRYPFFSCSQEVLRCDTPKFNGNAVLIAGNGDFNVKHYHGKFNAYQRTYVILPPALYYGCVYFSALQRIESFKNKSNGSIVKFITKGDVESIGIYECNDINIYQTLNQIIHDIENNRKQIDELLNLRDTLLPVLINGQITVNYHLSDD